MGVYDSTGARVTKSGLSTAPVGDLDPQVKVLADYWATRPYDQIEPVPVEGLQRYRAFRAGQVVHQSEIDALYPPATATSISPATGPSSGGTTVVIAGVNLDGVAAVAFGGAPATALTVLDATRVRCTAPAHTPGPVTVVITDDSGNVVKPAFYTYSGTSTGLTSYPASYPATY